ncbi:MAG: polysaccharide deacetylase family protein [Candidatus Dojkabacteria bacterium]
MLHEIVADDVTPKRLQISYSNFRSLIERLKNKGNVLSMEEFYDCFSNKEFKGEYVITFDDVYESVYQFAFPLLIANNIPFTLFINISLLDTPGFITTNQLIEMSRSELCTIGSHGIHHVFFRDLKEEDVGKELKNSKKALEQLINKPVNCFAFPYGSFVACSFDNIRKVKKSSFYKMSFGTIPSSVWNSTVISRYFIHRVDVTKSLIEKI